jgi:hypothetical protein
MTRALMEHTQIPFAAKAGFLGRLKEDSSPHAFDLLLAVADDPRVEDNLRQSAIRALAGRPHRATRAYVELLQRLVQDDPRDETAFDLWWVAVRAAAHLDHGDAQWFQGTLSAQLLKRLERKDTQRTHFERTAKGTVQAEPATGFTEETLDQELKVLAYALSRMDPNGEGLALLKNGYDKVRRGAIAGLWAGGSLETVEALERVRLTRSSDALLSADTFRAIDLILRKYEATEDEGEKASLRRLAQTFTGTAGSDPAFFGRVTWTIREAGVVPRGVEI